MTFTKIILLQERIINRLRESITICGKCLEPLHAGQEVVSKRTGNHHRKYYHIGCSRLIHLID